MTLSPWIYYVVIRSCKAWLDWPKEHEDAVRRGLVDDHLKEF